MPTQHTVCVGENLQSIADRYYGNAQMWRKIFVANQQRLKSPEDVQPGERLTIPD